MGGGDGEGSLFKDAGLVGLGVITQFDALVSLVGSALVVAGAVGAGLAWGVGWGLVAVLGPVSALLWIQATQLRQQIRRLRVARASGQAGLSPAEVNVIVKDHMRAERRKTLLRPVLATLISSGQQAMHSAVPFQASPDAEPLLRAAWQEFWIKTTADTLRSEHGEETSRAFVETDPMPERPPGLPDTEAIVTAASKGDPQFYGLGELYVRETQSAVEARIGFLESLLQSIADPE